MQGDSGVKRNDNPSCSSLIDSVAALRAKPDETSTQERIASTSGAVRRGALGMNFYSCGEHDLSRGSQSLFIGERF